MVQSTLSILLECRLCLRGSIISKPKRLTIPIIASIAVAGVFLLLIGLFALYRGLSGERILGRVTVLDTGLGGLTSEEADEALQGLLGRLSAAPAEFTVNGQTLSLSAPLVGFEIDSETMIREAVTLGRDGGVMSQFGYWLKSLFSTREIELKATLDDEMLDRILETWDTTAIGNPTFEGAIEVSSGNPVPVYPRTGSMVDREGAKPLILEQLSQFDRSVPELAIVTATPILTDADVDEALSRARLLLDGPITLSATVLRPPVPEDPEEEPDPNADLVPQEVEITFNRSDLLAAFRSEPAVTTNPTLRLFFDPEVIGSILDLMRGDLEGPPLDASFEIDENNVVSIVAGRPGTVIDPEATAIALESAATRTDRTGSLPFLEGQEPEVTTEYLQSLGVEHLVSSFTTYHPCCQNRVVNIHTIADAVDGTLVLPGETFSLNEHVGMRTRDKGYLPAPGVEGGEIVDSIGGGVSQFATTFYNAVFWGGYEDVSHTPHSYYFNRYPRGSEATVSWPKPHLVFKNDSEYAILIKTEYTNTSITVKFFSNNDGHTLVGQHKNNSTDTEILSEGGPNARKVTRETEGPYNSTDPEDVFISDETVEPGAPVKEQTGWRGYTIKVTRNIEQNGEVTSQTWTVYYRPAPNIFRIHPCENPAPEEGETPWVGECPTTTTTTVPETTTTTSEAE